MSNTDDCNMQVKTAAAGEKEKRKKKKTKYCDLLWDDCHTASSKDREIIKEIEASWQITE